MHAYAYVKNTEYDAYNTAFGNADADVLSYADYDRDPTITTEDLTVKDQSFDVSYETTFRNFTTMLSNVPIRFRVGAFTTTNTINDADLISFFRDANVSHVDENITPQDIYGGYPMVDMDALKQYDDINLDRAVTLPRLNAYVPVTTYVESNTRNYRFFGSDTKLILLKGRTYYFNQSDGSNDGHPIYFKRPSDGSEFTDGVTYVVGDNKYTNIADYHANFNYASNPYVRFDVPTTPSGDIQLYYECQVHSYMNGSVTLVDDPTEPIDVSTKTRAPNTTYHIYSFVEDDTPRKNTAVSAVQSRQTGAPPTVVFNYAAFTTEHSS